MEEYLENGASLGWLLNPRDQTALIYRPGAEVETVSGDARRGGEMVSPGFELDLGRIWRATKA